MITVGSGSPIVVSVPEGVPEEPIADFLAALFPAARITVAGRRQSRVALGTTGEHDRSAVVEALTALLGEAPAGASLANVGTPAPAPYLDASAPEIIRVAELLGAKVHDASDYIDLPRSEALAILTELAPDDFLRSAVAVCLR